MKASRFVKAFEKEVDYWERTLSHILEVIEMTLTVQRQWMYLEVWNLLKEEEVGSVKLVYFLPELLKTIVSSFAKSIMELSSYDIQFIRPIICAGCCIRL